MRKNNTVQILMAVYNGEKYLCDQLDSILNQTFKNWELLVSDDCSSDRSYEILERYAADDSRIKIVSSQKKFGSAKSNFMYLFKLASADYVLTCDQDDVWDPDKIEKVLYRIQQEDSNMPILVCTDLRVVDENLNVLDNSFLNYSNMDCSKLDFNYFLASSIVTGCTMIMNKSLLNFIKLPVNINNIIMHDWWASLIASQFGKVIYLQTTTMSYRQHSSNSVGAEKFSIKNAFNSLSDKRKVNFETYVQAREFLKVFNFYLAQNQVDLLNNYSLIPSLPRYKRVAQLNKCHVWRRGLIRNLGLIFTVLL